MQIQTNYRISRGHVIYSKLIKLHFLMSIWQKLTRKKKNVEKFPPITFHALDLISGFCLSGGGGFVALVHLFRSKYLFVLLLVYIRIATLTHKNLHIYSVFAFHVIVGEPEMKYNYLFDMYFASVMIVLDDLPYPFPLCINQRWPLLVVATTPVCLIHRFPTHEFSGL